MHRDRFAPALLVLALLAAAPAFSQARRSTAPPASALGSSLRSYLPDFVTRVWAELGCEIDSCGGACGSVAPTGDSGCDIDPYGHCRAAAARRSLRRAESSGAT
jgi:hypothetical protein